MLRFVIFVFLSFANLVDGLATLSVVSRGVEEANPAMRLLLTTDPLLFVAFKFFTVPAMVIIACACAPRWALYILGCAYSLVLMVHIWGLATC